MKQVSDRRHVSSDNAVKAKYLVSTYANKYDHEFRFGITGMNYKVCTREKYPGLWTTCPTKFSAAQHPPPDIVHHERCKLVARPNDRRKLARAGKVKFKTWELDDLKGDMAAYYRYCLLRNIDKGMESVVPDQEWHHQYIRQSIEAARDLYYDVHPGPIENRKESPIAHCDEGAPVQSTPEPGFRLVLIPNRVRYSGSRDGHSTPTGFVCDDDGVPLKSSGDVQAYVTAITPSFTT